MKLKMFQKIKSQKGVAIYFAAAVTSIVLAIALGLGALMTSRVKALNEAADSVVAFSAAQVGLELALTDITGSSPMIGSGYSGAETFLSNGASYQVSAASYGVYLRVQSIGRYNDSRRTVSFDY